MAAVGTDGVKRAAADPEDGYLSGPHTALGLEESSSRRTNLLPLRLQESPSLDKPPFPRASHKVHSGPVSASRLKSTLTHVLCHPHGRTHAAGQTYAQTVRLRYFISQQETHKRINCWIRLFGSQKVEKKLLAPFSLLNDSFL